MVIMDGDNGSWESLISKMNELDSIEIDAGYLTDHIHPNSKLSYAELATIHQYGSEKHNIPERPFISDGAVLSIDTLYQVIPESYKTFLMTGNIHSWSKVGKISAESIRRAIAEQKFTRLSNITIKERKAKGNPSTHILIEDGYLINNVEYKVNKKA